MLTSSSQFHLLIHIHIVRSSDITSTRQSSMPPEEDFSVLVNRAQSGDEAALERLMSMHHATVSAETTKFAGSLKSEVSVQDLEQETWIRVWSRLPTFVGADDNEVCQRTFISWLKTTTRRVALSIVEAGSAQKRGGDKQPATLDYPIDDDAKSPSSIFRADEQKTLLAQAVEEIESGEAAEVVRLHYFDGLPIAEVAERTGLTTDQVRYRLNVALKTLRREMDD